MEIIYIFKIREPQAVQLTEAFVAQDSVAMIGVQVVEAEELSKVGVCRGTLTANNIYKCNNFVEKPSLSFARDYLVTEGLQSETFLAHCGIYVFSPKIFKCLKYIKTLKENQEIELADAQSILLQKNPERYMLCKIMGRAYDIGTPAGYAKAQNVFKHPVRVSIKCS